MKRAKKNKSAKRIIIKSVASLHPHRHTVLLQLLVHLMEANKRQIALILRSLHSHVHLPNTHQHISTRTTPSSYLLSPISASTHLGGGSVAHGYAEAVLGHVEREVLAHD